MRNIFQFRFGAKGNYLYYVACWTEENGSTYACVHEHTSIREALDCLIPNGNFFIRANEEGHYRSLQEDEIREFNQVIQQMPWATGLCRGIYGSTVTNEQARD